MKNFYTFLDEYKLAVQHVTKNDGTICIRVYRNGLDDQNLLLEIDNGEVTYFYL